MTETRLREALAAVLALTHPGQLPGSADHHAEAWSAPCSCATHDEARAALATPPPSEPLDARHLETQLVMRAGHLPSCGDGSEFPWECTCDYGGFMEAMGRALAARLADTPGGTDG